jgi:nucleotide-binding universal stress UspA family protein
MTKDNGVDQANELRVVVGDDGSPCARQAVAFAAHEAARRGALLEIVSSFHLPSAAGALVVPVDPFREAAEEIVRSAEAYANDLESEINIKGETTFSAAGPALVDAAEGATLLVVGTRGHGDLASLVLGSVSTYVLHHADCTVTVVR